MTKIFKVAESRTPIPKYCPIIEAVTESSENNGKMKGLTETGISQQTKWTTEINTNDLNIR